MGSSSGGHQAMLAAMRPNDPRYSEIRLPARSPAVDAPAHYVVMYWPVIDPLARYHYARKLKAGGKPYPELVDLVMPLHDKYWKPEEEPGARAPTGREGRQATHAVYSRHR
jgi:acetyl esterase